MVFRFTVISNEVEDFVREIKIDSDATFLDLHQIILSSCNYEEGQITSFIICNEEWEQEQEVVLEDMGTSLSEDDLYIMRSTRLSELLEEEKQRMIYIYDPINERAFFIELTEIIFGEPQAKPVCSRQVGYAPLQFASDEDVVESKKDETNEIINEEFNDDEDFDNDEFDPEGFEISEGNPYNN